MKTTSENLKLVLLTIILVMMTTGIFAQRQQKAPNAAKPAGLNEQQMELPPPPPPPAPPEPPQPPDQFGLMMSRGLNIPDLSEDQRQNIKKVDLAHLEKMTPLRHQLMEKNARLASLLVANPFDLKETEKIADEIGKIKSSKLKLQISHDQELRSLLTPEQKIIFDSRPKPFLGKRKLDFSNEHR